MNVIRARRSLSRHPRANQTPMESFNKFFTQEICIRFTNQRGNMLTENWHEIDMIELDAFLGVY